MRGNELILEPKKVLEVFDEYEKELFEEHMKLVMKKSPDTKTTITAAQVTAVREIRARIGLPEKTS